MASKPRKIELDAMTSEEREEAILKYARARAENAARAGGDQDPYITLEQLQRRFTSQALETAYELVKEGRLGYVLDTNGTRDVPLFYATDMRGRKKS